MKKDIKLRQHILFKGDIWEVAQIINWLKPSDPIIRLRKTDEEGIEKVVDVLQSEISKVKKQKEKYRIDVKMITIDDLLAEVQS